MDIQLRNTETQETRQYLSLNELNNEVADRIIPEGRYLLEESKPGEDWVPVLILIIQDDGDRRTRLMFA